MSNASVGICAAGGGGPAPCVEELCKDVVVPLDGIKLVGVVVDGAAAIGAGAD